MTGNPNEVRARAIEPRLPAAYDDDGPHQEIVDWRTLYRYLSFALGSVRRRPLLFVSVSAGSVVLAAVAVAVLPKTYEVEAHLLTQRNGVLVSRADSTPMEPTRAAADTIVSRDNVRALIEQTDLLREWPKRRAPLLRVKDWLLRISKRQPGEKDVAEGLADLLQDRLAVWVSSEGTVVIKLRWPDPVMAYRLVDAAQQNFLEKRYVLEVSTIVEQISILEGHAARIDNDVEARVSLLQRAIERSAPKVARAIPTPAAARPADTRALDLRVMLEAKRHAIADLEEFRQRHIVELQTRLAEQRAIYSATHPMMTDLQRSIESLRHESPQLSALREEEKDLRRRVGAPSSEVQRTPAAPAAVPEEASSAAQTAEDASVEYARAQLRYFGQQSAALRERIDAARIDLDTARAAFKYRYSIVAPPQIPRRPIKPRLPAVLLAAALGGLFLALFATVASDVRAGLALERWQIADLLHPPPAMVDVYLAANGAGQPARESPHSEVQELARPALRIEKQAGDDEAGAARTS